MANILKSKNLVELNERLNEFATYHQNKGGQMAHGEIRKFISDNKGDRDGSQGVESYNQGYDAAIKEVLGLLHKKFVP